MSDIVKVLNYYGADCSWVGSGWTKINCPFHADSVASGCVLANDEGRGGYICFGCGRKGDAIALIMEEEDLDFTGAVARYQDITGTEHVSVSGTTSGVSRGDLFEGKRAYERNASLFPDWFLPGSCS